MPTAQGQRELGARLCPQIPDDGEYFGGGGEGDDGMWNKDCHTEPKSITLPAEKGKQVDHFLLFQATEQQTIFLTILQNTITNN